MAKSAPTPKKVLKGEKKDKTPREPSAYNVFMKAKTAELKASHPDQPAGERKKEVLALWKVSPNNPKRATDEANESSD